MTSAMPGVAERGSFTSGRRQSLVGDITSQIEEQAKAVSQQERTEKLKKEVDKIFDENLQLRRKVIPDLNRLLDTLYDHLPPEMKETFLDLDTVIKSKKESLAYIEYKNETIREQT